MGAVLVRGPGGIAPGELEFELLADRDGSDSQRVRIHPWDRGRNEFGLASDRQVFISIGWFDATGEPLQCDEGGEYLENAIVDREDFVEGILAVFPELKRA